MTKFKLLDKLQELYLNGCNTNEFNSVFQTLRLSLNESKSTFDTITRNMGQGFAHCKIICDELGNPVDCRFLAINKVFAAYTGINKNNIIGTTLLEIYPDIERTWLQHLGKVALTQEPISFTQYNHNTDKDYTVSAYSNVHGEFITLIDEVLNITELNAANKKVEDALKSNTAILANMSEAFAHCEVVYNNQGIAYDFRVLEVNKAYRIQTGIINNDIVGKTILEFFPDVEQTWLDTFIEVALTQQSKSFIDYNHNTGKYYDMHAYSPEKGFFIIIFKDITDKELNRIKLEESENSKSQLLKNLTDGFAHCELIYDDNGDPIDYRILDVNPIYEIQTGIPAKDIIGKKALDVFPVMKPSWIKICADVALKQNTYSFVDYNSTTNKYYETNAYSPKKGEFALIFRDVTARENKRVLLEKAYEKASENEKLKSAFLANMSHEIRTPMNAILGCSALLENDDLEREESLRYLSHIKSSGHRLLSIISDIMDISKIDAQQQTLNYAEHDLNDVLTRLKEQFDVTNTKPNISLVFDKGLIDGEGTIHTDETKLIQILSNLLENAFKFTEEGQIRFGYKLNGAFLNFYVKDSGIGIKQEDCPKVFERFRQVLDTKTKINSGSGLGISICKGLVVLFGGEITLESEFGKGSTFHFTLPYLPIKKG
jgi:signal transduction histidine kinase